MLYATVGDVHAAFERAVPSELGTFVATQLEYANTLLDVRVPSLAARVVATPALAVLARKAVVEAVLRVLRNPEGFKGEHSGEYGFYYSESAAAGRLDFSPDDLADLQPSGRRSTIRSVGFDDDALVCPTRRVRVREDVETVGQVVTWNWAQQGNRDGDYV